MKYVIQYQPSWEVGTRYVRVYQNGRQWVDRMHAKTATQFDSEAAAQALIDKFNLKSLGRLRIVTA